MVIFFFKVLFQTFNGRILQYMSVPVDVLGICDYEGNRS